MTDETWSDETKAYTRTSLEDMDFVSRMKRICFKHKGGGFAYILGEDVLRGHYALHAMATDEAVETFNSVDELLAGNWVLD